MTYNRNIHPYSHLVKALLGNTLCRIMPASHPQLLVLNYHGTPKKFLSNFSEQLQFLKDHFELLSPTSFKNCLSTTAGSTGRKLLLTFDDGLKNNLYAAEILSRMNVPACFFVVPRFIDTPADQQKQYYTQYIRPLINPAIDEQAEDFVAMSWQDLKSLSGFHTIGCHTLTHALSATTTGTEELHRELLQSGKLIEQQLNVPVDTFCSINNTLLSVNAQAKKLINANYAYHFTTFGGNNLPDPDPKIIRRINVESHWLKGAFRFALSPLELNRWEARAQQYRTL